MLSRIRHGQRETATERLSKDVLFDILSNPRRRHALHFLKQRGGPAEVGEMAETLAAWEHGTAVEAISSKQRKRVYTSLYQSHLPKMQRAGIVDYDRPRGVVDLKPAAEELEIHLEVVGGNDVPWSVFHFGLAGLFAGVVLALAVGTFPFTLVSPVAWMGTFAGLFLVSAAVHVALDRRSALGTSLRPPDVPEYLDDLDDAEVRR
jgi:DNA-binding transcriptional ArsR family regulator